MTRPSAQGWHGMLWRRIPRSPSVGSLSEEHSSGCQYGGLRAALLRSTMAAPLRRARPASAGVAPISLGQHGPRTGRRAQPFLAVVLAGAQPALLNLSLPFRAKISVTE